MNEYPAAQRAYNKAKIQMMMSPESLSYAFILFSLRQEWNENIPIAQVNSKTLVLNPNRFIEYTTDEQIGLLMHEMLHIMLQHTVRLGTRDATIFNIAGDYVINSLLIERQYTIPACGLYDPKYKDMNTEQVYELIYKDNKQSTPQTIPGSGADIDYAPVKDLDAAKADLSQLIYKAITQAKTQSTPGNIPRDVLVLLDKLLNPILPWNIILQNYMSAFAKDDYSWSKPNKRYFPEFYIPSMYSEALGNIAIAVDSSCSVSDAEFNRFTSEIVHIQQYLQPELITILDFDTEIKHEHKITPDTDIHKNIKFTGRGGTCIKPVLEWGQEHRPTVLLVFTDGEFYLPKNFKPVYPIIWLIHGDSPFNPDFGKVIRYNIED